MIQSIVPFILALMCYSISQLAQHRKIKWWSAKDLAFWGDESWVRKYKLSPSEDLILAPNTWYYRLFKLKYKERFPLSATFLVALTDGYHMMQSLMFLFLSFGISQLSHINFFIVWPSLLVVFSLTYRLLQR